MACLNSRVLVCLPLMCCGLAFGQAGALRIVEPVAKKGNTIVTREPAIALRGTLAWTGGDRRVLWKNQRGFSDLAEVTLSEDKQTIEWRTATPIPLRPGVNLVRVEALGQHGAEDFLNIYYTAPVTTPPRLGATLLHGRQIAYEVRNGRAVYQSDMILGEERDVAEGRFAGRPGAGGVHVRPQAATIEPSLQYASGLWPVVNGMVRVPYTMTTVNATNINAAIAESNSQLTGVVQWVPATGSDVNLVNFSFNAGNLSGSCEAIVGMQGGTQPISGAGNCTVGTILHEMGHALGLYHEQSRVDRNSYLNYTEGLSDKPQHGNFDILPTLTDSGLYNYASIMEYGAFAFSRYGTEPVLETIPAGIPLGTSLPQYTTGDLDGIMRLYGFTPAGVTIDTNPSGLNVVVDGVTYSAPVTFSSWAIGSQHTLKVPLDSNQQTLQLLAGQPYVFGNWNANPQGSLKTPTTTQAITITNSAGDGTLLSPASAPAITNYLASFIPVHTYGPTIKANNGASGSSVGSVQVLPSPGMLIINGVSTNYFLDRQYISLTATAKAGYTFFVWAHVPLDMAFASSADLYLTTDLTTYQGSPVTAFFVNDAVTTITGGAEDVGSFGISPGFGIGVTETSQPGGTVTFGYTPVNFDKSQDGAGFAPGQTLQLCASGWTGATCPAAAVAQAPVTTNETYLFYAWNSSGSGTTNALNLTIPAAGGSYNANYAQSFRVIILPSISSQFCPGVQVTTVPGPATNSGTDGGLDAFYPYSASTIYAITATGGSGVNFVEWTGDLGSSASPYDQTITNQLIATANFNVAATSAPLAVTGVVDSLTGLMPAVTGNARMVTVSGTGFTTNGNTFAYVGVGGGVFDPRTITVQSSTQLKMQMNAGDLASVGYTQILLVNTGGSGCNPETVFAFPVANSSGAPALSIAKMHSGVFGPGEQNAQYTITVSNSGTGAIGEPVTVSDTLPAGETLVSMSGGSTWNCAAAPACTNVNALPPGQSYPAIVVTVNVAAGATSPQVNTATASGGGAQTVTATDSTTIVATVSVPDVRGDSQNQAETAIVNAGLTVGQVTNATSPTVPAGDVIGTSPSSGVSVAPGTPVNVVLSLGAVVVLQSIGVTPANPSVMIGGSQQFTATGAYSDNSTKNLTAQVTWGSAKALIATITSGAAGGLASAVGIGSSTISATLNSIGGSTTLTVMASPCDLNQDTMFTVIDVQAEINEALGKAPAANDLNGDHVVNAVDIQIVINAALSLGCTL